MPLGKSDKLRAEAILTVSWEEKRGPEIVPMMVPDFAIVYDDDDFVVVDKPVGVAAHPAASWDGPTVLGALAAAGFTISTSGAAERAGIVHRLDVGTSGLMVVAKSEKAYSALKQAFHDREVNKIYHAVVQGHCDPLSGTIDAPIDRHPQHDYKWAVVSSGKPSITHYDTLEAFPHASLLEVHLETGRTHQIRVHMAHLGHPLVSDVTYGGQLLAGLNRQALHAWRLSLAHPHTGQALQWTCPPPPDLRHGVGLQAMLECGIAQRQFSFGQGLVQRVLLNLTNGFRVPQFPAKAGEY